MNKNTTAYDPADLGTVPLKQDSGPCAAARYLVKLLRSKRTTSERVTRPIQYLVPTIVRHSEVAELPPLER